MGDPTSPVWRFHEAMPPLGRLPPVLLQSSAMGRREAVTCPASRFRSDASQLDALRRMKAERLASSG